MAPIQELADASAIREQAAVGLATDNATQQAVGGQDEVVIPAPRKRKSKKGKGKSRKSKKQQPPSNLLRNAGYVVAGVAAIACTSYLIRAVRGLFTRKPKPPSAAKPTSQAIARATPGPAAPQGASGEPTNGAQLVDKVIAAVPFVQNQQELAQMIRLVKAVGTEEDFQRLIAELAKVGIQVRMVDPAQQAGAGTEKAGDKPQGAAAQGGAARAAAAAAANAAAAAAFAKSRLQDDEADAEEEDDDEDEEAGGASGVPPGLPPGARVMRMEDYVQMMAAQQMAAAQRGGAMAGRGMMGGRGMPRGMGMGPLPTGRAPPATVQVEGADDDQDDDDYETDDGEGEDEMGHYMDGMADEMMDEMAAQMMGDMMMAGQPDFDEEDGDPQEAIAQYAAAAGRR